MADLEHAVLGIVAALVIVGVPILAHTIHPLLGMLAVVLLAGTCAVHAPPIAVVTILFSFMFQNLIVSLLAGWVHSKAEFDIIRAYNFLILCVCWLVIAGRFLARWRTRPVAIDRIVTVTVAALVAIGVYFVIGFALYGTAAIVNLRNIATPILFFQICLLVFATQPVRIGPALTGIGILVIFCGFTEFFYRDVWLAYTNGEIYWTLFSGPNWATLAYDKQTVETGKVITSLTDTFKISFFNSPLLAELGVQMMRLFGPNMHAISFSYCLTFFAVFTLYRGRFVQAAIFLVLIFLCSVKGPVIILLLVGVSWAAFRLFGARFAFILHCSAVSAYAVLGIFVGMRIGDYHVLGLMSGLQEFLGNPIGRGIGTGGNLSPLFSTINWQHAQALGHTPFPVESSVGVLLYQMGIFAFVPIAAYIWIAWQLLVLGQKTQNSLHVALSFTVLSIVANGLFQEEAFFSPLSLAIFLGLAGMILGAGIRVSLIQKG